MRGDGLGNLALVIFIVMILIVLGGLLLGVLLSRSLARSLGWSGAKRSLTMLGLGAIGVGGGVLVVIATFFEQTWAPPPQVTFNVPPGFTQHWVILLEDRLSSTQLVWEGVEMPFFGKKTVIDVPPSGIVRVRDLSVFYGLVETLWNDGSYSDFRSSGPAPESTGATRYSAFNRVKAGGKALGEVPRFPDGAALGAYIAARERGAP
jgi:hypothetical protein